MTASKPYSRKLAITGSSEYPLETIALAAACLAFGTAPALAQGGAMKDKAKAAAKSAANPDEKFVMDAAQGGMLEVQLGTLATQKAASDDVKQFGQRMVDDHSKANTELTTLAGQKNITLSTALDAKNQAMVDKLSKLSGAALGGATAVGVYSANQLFLRSCPHQCSQDSRSKTRPFSPTGPLDTLPSTGMPPPR